MKGLGSGVPACNKPPPLMECSGMELKNSLRNFFMSYCLKCSKEHFCYLVLSYLCYLFKMQEITFLLYCVFIFTSFGSCFTMCVCVFIWCRISVVAGWRASSLTVWTGMTRFSTLITWNPVFPSTRCMWKRTTQLLNRGPHSGEQLLWIYVKLQSSVCPHFTCPVACWKAALDVDASVTLVQLSVTLYLVTSSSLMTLIDLNSSSQVLFISCCFLTFCWCPWTIC